MEVTLVNLRKLQIMFDAAWKRICEGNRPICVECDPDRRPSDSEFWTLYMNFLDCLMIEKEDLLENFDEMVNFGSAVKESVCLKDPCNDGDYILVRHAFAEKCLVLGTLV